MRVLVTGGAGYVGSTTAQRLIEARHDVVVIDTLELGHRAAVPEGAVLVEGDIRDRPLLESTLREHSIEAVLHCAGYSLVGESVQQPQRYFDNNVGRGIEFLDGLLAAGISRVVFSSSAGVYGVPSQTPIQETDALAPTHPYGATKLALEHALSSYATAYRWRVVSVRYFNAAGATDQRGEHHRPETHLIPNILGAVERDEIVRINGSDYPTPDGTCVRDYVHVDDLAAGHIAALELTATAQPGHLACNLGTGTGFSNLEVLRTAESVVGHPIRHEMGERRPGDPPALVASNGRARELLGWEPHRSLEDIVSSAWEWRRRHPGGYES